MAGEEPGQLAEMACALWWQLVAMASDSGSVSGSQSGAEDLGLSLTGSLFRMHFEAHSLNPVCQGMELGVFLFFTGLFQTLPMNLKFESHLSQHESNTGF